VKTLSFKTRNPRSNCQLKKLLEAHLLIMLYLQYMGMAIQDNIKHSGPPPNQLTPTVEKIMAHIEPKEIKHSIMATMPPPPIDVLHRATLNSTALLPVYNHAFTAASSGPCKCRVGPNCHNTSSNLSFPITRHHYRIHPSLSV
jgi:hypothetical protein